ncbi:hypothetical protein [Halobaculum sp. EA56]|uniref:hypothetical protein n=1 Tax=Halobaculum sp. EA56 TaxID=3421648 RepID=UPI003EC149C2
MASSKREWRTVSPNPDPTDDLEYELVELDFIPTTTSDGEEVLVLPTDEEMLHDDAFLIVDRDSVVELERRI